MWLVASPLAPRLFQKITISVQAKNRSRGRGLNWFIMRETKWRTQLKNSNDAINMVCIPLFPIFFKEAKKGGYLPGPKRWFMDLRSRFYHLPRSNTDSWSARRSKRINPPKITLSSIVGVTPMRI